jgi:ABC-type arginine transport system permease subunit
METYESLDIVEPYNAQTFGKDVAQSAAITVGVAVGFIVVGLAIGKVQEYRAAREAKKAAKNES